MSFKTDPLIPDRVMSEETAIRMAKVERMRAAGIEPWPAAVTIPDNAQTILNQFGTRVQKDEYVVAGRIMSLRAHGKTMFADVQDGTGWLQLYFKKDLLGAESFEQLQQFVDIGDVLRISGAVFRTNRGEITLDVHSWQMLSKSLHPLPEKFHGLTDIEIKYRQRYLDLITSQESKQRFLARFRLIKALRTFLDEHGFLEVETPMLHPIAGGAAARPFVTHHNALSSDFYLRIAPELYLKRLVVGGFERVYEINRNFRNEGISTRHNPEFTMLEFYMAHQDYHQAMNFVEQLLRYVLLHSANTLQIPFGEVTIDFEKPFKRITIFDSVVEIGGIAHNKLTPETIDATMREHGIKPKHSAMALAEKVYALFEECVEKKLTQPTFVTDFPVEVSPLAKRDPHNEAIAARFELFIGGMEISNGFNELNDPIDQAERFKQQLVAHRAGDDEAHQYDAEFIEALEYALPPTAGVGIGIDRLVMLATNTLSIKEVILFPTLKKRHG